MSGATQHAPQRVHSIQRSITVRALVSRGSIVVAAMTKPTPCAIGLSVHTGWAACCVVSGDVRAPGILARGVIEILGDRKRFGFHLAAGMKPADAARSVTRAREHAVRAAGSAL